MMDLENQSVNASIFKQSFYSKQEVPFEVKDSTI